MFFTYEDEKFKFTGRWGRENEWVKGICATACGSKIEFGFKGRDLVLHFNTNDNVEEWQYNLYSELLESGVIKETDKVLIVDDFLANGNAAMGIMDLAEQAGAAVEGMGFLIEKGFQKGGEELRSRGLHVESLAIIDSLDDCQITFR